MNTRTLTKRPTVQLPTLPRLLLLALPGARVYDLDADPPRPRRWTELENVQIYRRFFAEHAAEFTP